MFTLRRKECNVYSRKDRGSRINKMFTLQYCYRQSIYLYNLSLIKNQTIACQIHPAPSISNKF